MKTPAEVLREQRRESLRTLPDAPRIHVPIPARSYAVETEQETDGRWIAEIPQLAGVMAYGSTKEEAIENAKALESSSSRPRVLLDEGPK